MKRANLHKYWSIFSSQLWRLFSFFFLLVFYLIGTFLELIFSWKIFQKTKLRNFDFRESKAFSWFSKVFDRKDKKTISRIELIELAISNFKVKKTRNLVTVGGMAIGIAAIVFLMSIGYGLQDLVVQRVAGLEEINQADIYPPRGGKLKLNDQTIIDINQIEHVENALPLIALVAQVNYNNSVVDMPAYGVTSEYLERSALKPVRGVIFDNNELDLRAETEILRVNEDNSDDEASPAAQVLDAKIVKTDDGEFVELSEAEQSLTDLKKEKILSKTAKEAIVNRAMLNVLGIDEKDAIDQEFEASFTVIANLLSEDQEKFISYPTKYKIVGVNAEEKSPLFYLPFIDFKSLGVINYSQLKIVVDDKDNLVEVRREIEAMGFMSSSVVDTIEQINSLFSTARLIFALMGFIALAVASLGMFNTLTVSLLERTKEVALMKALGMTSNQVKELFITESMLMSFYGGVFGLLLGFIAGKLLGLFLSIYALGKGMGMIDVTFIPFYLLLIIIFLSLLVGLITGFYPARRSARISELDALRYE